MSATQQPFNQRFAPDYTVNPNSQVLVPRPPGDLVTHLFLRCSKRIGMSRPSQIRVLDWATLMSAEIAASIQCDYTWEYWSMVSTLYGTTQLVTKWCEECPCHSQGALYIRNTSRSRSRLPISPFFAYKTPSRLRTNWWFVTIRGQFQANIQRNTFSNTLREYTIALQHVLW